MRTHPLSEKRVADMRNRARSERRVIRPKALTLAHASTCATPACKNPKGRNRSFHRANAQRWHRGSCRLVWSRTLYQLNANEPVKARSALEQAMKLIKNIAFLIANASIDTALGRHRRPYSNSKTTGPFARQSSTNHGVPGCTVAAGCPHRTQVLKSEQTKARDPVSGIAWLGSRFNGRYYWPTSHARSTSSWWARSMRHRTSSATH